MQNELPINIEKDKEDEPGESWAEDQKERGYYYDDAHGYEQFDPECDDETEDIDESDESETD